MENLSKKIMNRESEVEVNFTISLKRLRELWSNQCDSDEWIEMFESMARNYDSYEVELQVGEYIAKKIINLYEMEMISDKEIPDVIKPVISQSLVNNFLNDKLNAEKVYTNEIQLEAVNLLRDYSYIDYTSAIDLFVEGYEFAKEKFESQPKSLSDYSTQELLEEIKRRI